MRRGWVILQLPRRCCAECLLTIQIKIDPRSPLLSVPASAVRPGDRVWVLRDGKLATEQVDVVMIVDGQALILAGHAPIRVG